MYIYKLNNYICMKLNNKILYEGNVSRGTLKYSNQMNHTKLWITPNF